ncbi:MAG TPA: PHP domain-containing protein [Candidatus Limnocylindrales bacterium]|nr:PHP domain-containing protein [Candidatus Limnocylindrales bacterium]
MLGPDTGSGRQRSFIDLHCHTAASFDSLSRPEAVARTAAARGLTHLAITDHERIDGALQAREAAPPGLSVIVGQEVRTRGGDLIGLYLERPIPPGLAASETADAIHEQGGLVGLPHPFDRFRASGARRNSDRDWLALLERVDYIEAWNARIMVGDGNLRAAELAHERGLPGVAASDAHTLMEVGVAYTAVEGHITNAAQLRAAFAQANLVTGRSSRLIRAGMPLAKGLQWLRGNRRLQVGA